MIAIRSIPRKLLIHSAVLHRVAGEDKWGKVTLEDGVELRHIRIEPSSRILRDKNNAEVQLAATLFYDCKSSSPAGMVFQEDDILMFHGMLYKVQTVEPLYDGSKLHHYEMGMVKYAQNKQQSDF